MYSDGGKPDNLMKMLKVLEWRSVMGSGQGPQAGGNVNLYKKANGIPNSGTYLQVML